MSGLAAAVEEAYGDQVGMGYNVGRSLPESAGFMAQMYLNQAGGLAKAAVKKYGTTTVKKVLARAAGDVAEMGIGTLTTGAGRVVEDAINRLNGQSTYDVDDNGIIRYGGQAEQEKLSGAVFRALGSNFIENYSEALGEYFSPVGGFLRNMSQKGLRKGGLGKLVDAFDRMRSSQWSKALQDFKEKTKFNGFVGEYAEEVAGNILNAVAVGDMNFNAPDDPRSVFNLETNLETALSCMFMSGTMMAVEGIGHRSLRFAGERKMAGAERDAERAFSGGVGNPAMSWENLRDGMDRATPGGIARMLSAIAQDADLTPEQKKAAINYGMRLAQCQAYNGRRLESREEMTEGAQAAEAAYDEGASMPPGRHYSAEQEKTMAGDALRDADANLFNVVNSILENGGAIGELERMLTGVPDAVGALARDYYNKAQRVEGIIDAGMEDAMDAGEEFERSMQDAIVTDEDGNRTVTTATYRDAQVFVLADDGKNATILRDGKKEIVGSDRLSDVQRSDADAVINEAKDKYLQEKQDALNNSINHHPKTQDPLVGMQLWSGDTPFIVTDVSAEGVVQAFPSELDSKTGQVAPKKDGMVNMSIEEAKNLQDEYYNRMDAESGNVPENEGENVTNKGGTVLSDPRTMSDEEKQRRGDMLRNATVTDVESGVITSTKEMTARKAAEKWWDENVKEPLFYDTEIGEVEINKNSVESSLAHRYGQKKLDSITSLADGFENAVYLGTMPDSRERGVVDHYFAYPIRYDGELNYVFCRVMQDANKNRLYVHEVFVAGNIKKGNTLQTAASKPHGGISLYKDILANVLLWEKGANETSATGVAPANVTTANVQQGNGQSGSASNQSNVLSEDKDSKPSSDDKEDNANNSIPVDKKGNVLYHKAPLETTVADLTDGSLTDGEIDAFISNNRKEAEKELKKIEGKAPKIGTNKAKYISEKKAWQAQVDEAQAKVDYWDRVRDAIKENRVQPGDKIAEEIRSMGEPMDGHELAAQMLANGLLPLLREDYMRETGFGNKEASGIFGLFRSKGNGGMTIEEAGEKLMLADAEAGTGFFDQDDANAGRNALLDVLSSVRTRGGLADYIKSNREGLAERERAAEQAYEEEQREAWAQEHFGMSYADYETFEEVIDEIIKERAIPEEVIQDFYDNFAEEINNWYNGRIKENVASDERRADRGGSESGEGLLPPEQPGDNRGTETDTSAEADGRADNEGVSAQEEAGAVVPSGSVEDAVAVENAQKVQDDIAEERKKVDDSPTDAQKKAGNYKKGHVQVDGYDITLENPKGSERSGTDAGGNEWSVTMNNDYGYIRGTEGVDGDHIDVFLSDNPVQGNVYVVDQINPETGEFDEHKVMYGFSSMDEAAAAYLANYSPGWKGLGSVSEVSKEEFRKWIESSHRKTKPFVEYKSVKVEAAHGQKYKPAAPANEDIFRMAERVVDENKDKPKEENDILYREADRDDGGKTLVGIHNISSEKFRKALRLGGFANPSAAVIDISKQSHEGYGEISLVLPSSMIDKRTGRNAGTFENDAWTPIYPQVERKFSDNGYERASKDIQSVPKEMQTEVRRGIDSWMDGRDAKGLAYLFLHERGEAPGMVLIENKYGDDTRNAIIEATGGSFSLWGLDQDAKNRIIDVYIKEEFNGDRDAYEKSLQQKVELMKNNLNNPRALFRKRAQEYLDGINERGFDYDAVAKFVRSVKNDAKHGGKVNDSGTTIAAINRIEERGLKKDFEKWIHELNDRYDVREVIFNGFTPSGNRRYIANTLENVSAFMKKSGRNAATGISSGFNNFAASVLKSKGTLKEIRKGKHKLTADHGEVDAFREKWGDVFYELGMKLQPGAKDFDFYGMERLSEAARSKNPKKYIKDEYGIDFSDEDMQKLDDMISAIRNEYPSMYFETKFERPVYLDEFAAAVVPDNMDEDLMKTLKDAGLNVLTYKYGDSADRKRALSEAATDDVLFREPDEVNRRFNEQLAGLTEENADRVTLSLGRPSAVLRAAGVTDKPMKLYGNKVIKKMKKHGFGLDELRDLPRAVANPIAVFNNYGKEGNRSILTEMKIADKNILVAITIGKGNDVDFNVISSVFGKGKNNIIDWINKGYATYINKKKALDYLNFSRSIIPEASNNREEEKALNYLHHSVPIAEALSSPRLDSAAKIIRDFENPRVSEEKLREGDDSYTGRERSKVSELMAAHTEELAKKLHLDNVEIVTDASTLDGKQKRAKGFYSKRTGKITIVVPNHADIADVEQTLLHEAVAHYGLRELFGEQFDTFLDNVFVNADAEVRTRIVELAERNGWDFRTATEEYLAGLAERTDFENTHASWWQKIKGYFLNMLHKIGFEGFNGVTLTDNELRYILWRSYENLAEPGRYRSIFGEAADAMKQRELKVGDYAETTQRNEEVADDSGEVLFRTDSVEELLDDWNSYVPSGPNVHRITNESDIEQLPYSNSTKRELKDKLNDKQCTGAYSNRNGAIFLFPHHSTGSVEELELTLWHETAHYASRKSGLDERLKRSCLDYVKSHYPEKYRGITEGYNRAKWTEEAVAYLFERKVKEYGAKRLLSSTFAGENDIAETFTQLINFIKNGREEYNQSGRDTGSAGNQSGKEAEGSSFGRRGMDVLDERRREGTGEKDYHESISNFRRTVKNHPDIYEVNSPEDADGLKRAGLSDATIESIKKDMNRKGMTGAYYPHGKFMVVYPVNIRDKEEFEKSLWHESVHYVLSTSDIKDKERLMDSCLEYVKEKHPDIYGKATYKYSEEEAPEESVAYLVEKLLEEYGADYLINCKFEGDNDIANLFTQLFNNLKDEKGRERNQLRQTDISQRDEGAGRERQGTGKSGSGTLEDAEQTVHNGREATAEADANGQPSVESLDFNPATDNLIEFAERVVAFNDNGRRQKKVDQDSTRFRQTKSASPVSTPTIEAWDKLASSKAFLLRETSVDHLTAVEKFQDLIAGRTKSEVKDYENAYQALLALSSKNREEMDRFEAAVVTPLNNAIIRITGGKKKSKKWNWNEGSLRELVMYVEAKCGMERNEVMNAENKTKRKDYSGLSSLFGDRKKYPDGWEKAAKDYVEQYEKAHSKEDVDELWKSIRMATGYALNKQLQSGLVSSEYVEKQLGRFKYYVPLRGFAEETAEDVYGYANDGVRRGANPVKTAKGRKSEAGNPFGAILEVGYSSISAGNKNLAKQKLYYFLLNHDTDGLTVVNRAWRIKLGELGNHKDLLVQYRPKPGEKLPEWVEAVPNIPDNPKEGEVADIMRRFEELMGELEKRKAATEAYHKGKTQYRTLHNQRSEHQIPLMIGGNRSVITITGNPRLAQAVNGLLNPDTDEGIVAEYAKKVQRFMAGAFTSNNIAFAIANLFKDTMYANNQTFIKENGKYWLEFTKNQKLGFVEFPLMMLRLHQYRNGKLDGNKKVDRLFKEFMENGGATGYTFVGTQKEYTQMLEKELKKLAADRSKANPKEIVKGFFDLVEFGGQASELVNRFAAYRTSRKMGRSISRSVTDAKEITVNFNRKGAGRKTVQVGNGHASTAVAVAPALSQYGRTSMLFFNANMQAKYRLYKNLREHPVKTSATLIGNSMLFGGVIVPFINYMVIPALFGTGGDDDDYYNGLTDYERTGNICIRLANGYWLKIPLSPEMAPWYSIGDMIGGAIMGKREMEASDFGKSLVDAFTPVNINWELEGGKFLLNFIPTVSQPIAQHVTNVNFMGVPLRKEDPWGIGEYDPEYKKVFNGTSPALVELSRLSNRLGGGDKVRAASGLANWNPRVLQNYISGYTGGFGTALLGVADLATAAMQGEEGKESGLSIAQTPLLSRFLISGDKDVKLRRLKSKYNDVKDFIKEFEHDNSGYEDVMEEASVKGDMMEYAEYKTKLDKLYGEKGNRYDELSRINDAVNDCNKYLKENPDDERSRNMLYELMLQGVNLMK